LGDESQAVEIAQAFSRGDEPESNSLYEGMSLADGRFDGFESLKARLQIDRLKTQYNDYKSFALGEVSLEINSVRSRESFEHKDNSIYVPTVGTSLVTDNLSSVTIKHHNLIQVVLSDAVNSQYATASFAPS